jgi:hypothetical protein
MDIFQKKKNFCFSVFPLASAKKVTRARFRIYSEPCLEEIERKD